jgi:two-component system sensor histidine kinase HydH
MDVNRLLLILVMCATLALGIFILLRNKRNAINISFFIMAITITLWTVSVFMILTLWRLSNPIQWVRIAYALGTFMVVSFVIFSVIFHREKFQPAKKYLIVLVPVCLSMAWLSMTSLSIENIEFVNGSIVGVKYGTGNKIWAMFQAICLILIYYNLGSKWRKGSGVEKLKVKYIFFGIVPTTVFMALTNILSPLMGYEKASGYGPVFTMIMLGCMAYAIVKHRLMDIRVFVKKGIVYSLLLAGSALVVGLLVIGIPSAFPEWGKVQSAVIILIGGAFIVFASKPFTQNLKNITQTFIFKDQYDYQFALSEFASSAAKLLDVEGLAKLTFNTTIENIKVGCASLWLKDSKTKLYTPVCSFGLRANDLQIILSEDNAIISYLDKVREPVVKEELEKILHPDIFDKIENDFILLKAEISMPLVAEDQIIGILNLSSKSHGSLYFEEDIAFLKAIMSQSSIAIQNARLHQQIANMDKLSFLGRLSAELAHEIKNPLVTIKTAFEIMEYQSNTDQIQGISSDLKNFISLAMRETDRINDLIKQLLYLGRPSPPKFEWCDINQIIGDTVLSLRRGGAEKNIEIVDLINSYPVEIYADEKQLRQVFLNIGQNALDAIKDGGKIIIEANIKANQENDSQDYGKYQRQSEDASYMKSDNIVVIKVSDTGKGMSREELKNIFEPFYSGKLSGTGLGLAIVNNIIREHSGVINVESVEGSGTTFTIELPQVYQKTELVKV